jgi:periplasmic protein CpxP/Spy
MKKQMALLTAILLAFTLTVTAQNQQPRQGGERPQMNPKERAVKLAKELELTAEQTQKVEALFEEQKTKMTELREKFQGNQDGRRTALQELRKKWDEELELIIGKEKMEKHRAAEKEQMRQGRENRPRQQQ